MNIAKCLIDNKEWRAEDFSKLPDFTINFFRKHLICTECKRKAFFSKAGSNGRGPLFGAKNHSGCELATVDDSTSAEGTLRSANKKINNIDEIEVDLNFGAHEYFHVTPSGDDGNSERGRKGWQHDRDDAVSVARSKRRLSTILNNLLSDPSYEVSMQVFKLPIIGRVMAKDVFKRWNSPIESDKYYLLWGAINGFKEQRYTTFLKGGSVDIMLHTGTLNSLKERFHINKTSDLIGMKIIVFAESRKTHIPVKSIELIHVSK